MIAKSMWGVGEPYVGAFRGRGGVRPFSILRTLLRRLCWLPCLHPLKSLDTLIVIVPRIRHALSAIAAAIVFASLAPPASAEPASSMSLNHARNTWDRGDIGGSETAYKTAIENGELSPSEVVESYVRIGCSRVLLGKKEAAQNAFRAAAVLDPSFVVPSEAGQKANQVAALAKKDVAKFGGISLSVSAPATSPVGKPIAVGADLDHSHLTIVKRLAVIAREGTSGKEYKHEEPTAEHVDFTIPAELAMPDASIVVRVDALDSYNNRIATQTSRVKAEGGDVKAAAGPTARGLSVAGAGQKPKESKSFWSTPWPYVIGGAVLAGAGTAGYFQFRPTDNVTVNAVTVRRTQ